MSLHISNHCIEVKLGIMKKIVLSLVVLALSACSDSGDKKTPAPVATPQVAATPADAVSTNRDFKVVETFETGENVYVRSMDIDAKAGRLWVGTTVGAIEVDMKTRNLVNTYTREHGLANEYIFALKVASDGSKWFGTNGGGISQLKDGQWKTVFPMHGLADYWVYSFTEDANGTMWVGTWAGLNEVKKGETKYKTYLKELVNEWVYGLDVDSKGNIWIGTEGGINKYDGKTWATWTHDDGLGAANLDNLPVSENTGLGTRQRHDLSVMMQGLPTYNPNYVFSLDVNAKDQVWAGTWGGGASFYDGNKWTNYSAKDGLGGNIVYAVAVDANDNVYFGTNKGVSYFDGKQWQTVTKQDGLIDNNVYAIAIAEDGGIWLGTRGGVALMQRK